MKVKKEFNEIELGTEIYSGTYTIEEIHGKLMPDEDHLNSLEGYKIEIIEILQFDEDENSWTKICNWSNQLDKDLKFEIEFSQDRITKFYKK